MATWTPQTKNTATYTTVQNNGLIVAGMPIGLLLALTYSSTIISTLYTTLTKNTATYNNVTKN